MELQRGADKKTLPDRGGLQVALGVEGPPDKTLLVAAIGRAMFRSGRVPVGLESSLFLFLLATKEPSQIVPRCGVFRIELDRRTIGPLGRFGLAREVGEQIAEVVPLDGVFRVELDRRTKGAICLFGLARELGQQIPEVKTITMYN